tara:strand:- start:8760 stop:10766 length:2007 start_codon:yes stop_codon:yes gene_type:complete
MTNSYSFRTVSAWDAFRKEHPQLRQKIIEQPLERWLDRTAKGVPIAPEESDNVLELGFFELSEGQLVARDFMVVSRILADRYAERLLLPTWDDRQEFSRHVDELNRFCILNKDYESAFPDALALLHNQHDCDVVYRSTEAFQSDQKTDGIWHGVSKALPYLNLELRSLISLLDEAMNSCEKGSSGFEAYASACKLGETQPEFSATLLEEIKASPHRPSFGLLSNIAIGLSRVRFDEMFDAAFEWISSSSGRLAAQGFYALGSFDYSIDDRDLRKRRYFDQLNRPFEARPTEALVALAYSIKNLLQTDDAEVVDWLRRLSKVQRSEVECAVANVLHNKQRDFSDRPWFREVLNNLVTASEKNPNLVASIDFALHGMSETDLEFVLDFIERWILNHEYDVHVPIMATFKSALSHLGSKSLAHYEFLVTRWFLADDDRLHRAASDIVEDLAGATLGDQFDIFHLDDQAIAEVDDNDSQFLMRKILGYVHDPRMLASLAFSMINCGEKATKKDSLVIWAFRKFVGYNYHGAAIELLSKKMGEGSDYEKRVAKECADKLKEYFDALDGPIPKELHPPRLRVGAYRKEVNKSFRQAKDSAMAASPLLSIFKTTQLLFGRSAAFDIGTGDTQISDLDSYEHSFEESRGDTIDPLGMRYRRLVWRHEQRGEDEADN